MNILRMMVVRSVERQEQAIKTFHATQDVRRERDEAIRRASELEREVARLKALLAKKTRRAKR